MSRAVSLDRRALVLVLAACLAAVGLVATSGAPAKADATTLYTLINQARQQSGLKPLVRDARMDAVAQAWTSRMASSGTLSHNPSYSTQIPAGWTRAGENVGYNYSDSALHTALMNSAGHRANILGSYTSVGIGWVKDSGGRIWATQVFASYPGVTAPAAVTTSPSVTDMTGDRRTDLVGVNSAGALVVVPGTGSGTLRSGVAMGSGWSAMRDLYPVSDASRDGVSDLYARGNDGRLWFYRGVSGGGVRSAVQVGTGWSGMTAIVDMDGNRDGQADLYARDASGNLFFYPSNGAGGFGKRVQVGNGWNGMTAMVSPGDLTSDGVADLVARDGSGRLWLYPGNARTGFLAPRIVGSGWTGLTIVAPGDLNGDRIGDLVARTSAGRFVSYTGTGRGGFRAGVDLGSSWSGLTKLG